MGSQDVMRAIPLGPVPDRADGIGVNVGRLERLDILLPVDHASTDLQKPRPFALPAPLLKSARRDQPSVGQALLVQVLHPGSPFLRDAPLYANALQIPREHLDALDTKFCGRD